MSTPAQPRAAGAGTRLRTEIQALRALAVSLVLVYHLWPEALPGGFTGVDVFFAISGYLITGHLLREYDATGRIRLARFWAQRARRLLPASFLVLGVLLVVTLARAPITVWSQYTREIGASALYIQNWQLAGDSVDYLASENEPSPVQHFWSLSVEEQFYVATPIIIVAVGALAGLLALRRRVSIAVVLGGILAGSLALSITLSATDPGPAYFHTAVRAWEFLAGAMLSFFPTLTRFARLRAALSWVGFAVIGAGAVLISAELAFPGWIALVPVVGTLLVIAAGTSEERWSPDALGGRTTPIQWLGGISYSLYLWHWPLIVLAPALLDRELGNLEKWAILLASLALAAVTKRWVEDPVRRAPLLAEARPRRTLLAMGAAMIVIVATVGATGAYLGDRVRASQTAVAAAMQADDPCLGAGAVLTAGCAAPAPDTTLLPDPGVIVLGEEESSECLDRRDEGDLAVCVLGVTDEPTMNFLLVGDSHSAHLRPAFSRAAAEQNWAGSSIMAPVGGCPLALIDKDLSAEEQQGCRDWNLDVRAWLTAHPEVDTVVSAAYSGGSAIARDGRTEFETITDGYLEAWAALPPSVQTIIVMRDNPRLGEIQPPTCVYQAERAGRDTAAACAEDRSTALLRDPAAAAAQRYVGERNVVVIDFTDVYCDADRCTSVIGGVLAYSDQHHLTTLFSHTLGGELGNRLSAELRAESDTTDLGDSPPQNR